ncbi:MAG: VIT1/CCC1 transporter family protein [Rectinemataceae bacterium]|jgi:VIT1/CCC1 family predicted Fe2+/Mn2+ transporter/rubrerythrin
MKNEEIKRLRANLDGERDAVFLYGRLADAEPNPDLAELYKKLAETERRHVSFWEGRLAEAGSGVPPFRPSFKARMTARFASRYGAQSVVSSIAKVERNAASGYDGQTDAESVGMPAEERSHARIFGTLARESAGGGMAGGELARFEGRHRAGGNALRAGTLGANDGLLSVYSLVMGVAGAGVGKREILVTGVAGLLAGALSMALGEWISVQSSRELYERQIDIERQELADSPEEEMEELSLIYRAKGLDPEQARATAQRILSGGGDAALDTLVREELAIDSKELGGSAWEAAITSFGLFSLGAILPVLPYVFFSGTEGIIASSATSVVGLFAIGALTTLMTGKNAVLYGLRHVLIGLVAAAVTFGIGRLIGVNVAG